VGEAAEGRPTAARVEAAEGRPTVEAVAAVGEVVVAVAPTAVGRTYLGSVPSPVSMPTAVTGDERSREDERKVPGTTGPPVVAAESGFLAAKGRWTAETSRSWPAPACRDPVPALAR
jgi:hypothetical protein